MTQTDNKIIYHPKSKIDKDNITIYGAGIFGESNLVLNKTRAMFLYIELTKFLKEES